jgi:hypothetical protein
MEMLTAADQHIGCYVLLVLTLVVLFITLMRRNAKREKAAGTADSGIARAFDDLTDKQNQSFRYQY